MIPVTHARFINSVKVGSGSESNTLTEKQGYTMAVSDNGQFLSISEHKNSQAQVLVPMSNVCFLWERAVEAKPVTKKTNA
jgi:hypothetical protein